MNIAPSEHGTALLVKKHFTLLASSVSSCQLSVSAWCCSHLSVSVSACAAHTGVCADRSFVLQLRTGNAYASLSQLPLATSPASTARVIVVLRPVLYGAFPVVLSSFAGFAHLQLRALGTALPSLPRSQTH